MSAACRIEFDLSVENAGCLNNAIRREIAAVERRKRMDGSLDIASAEYLRQLDACRETLDAAFARAIQ
jgi:hypothetical protein